MGKGCKRRPQQVEDSEMESNWGQIFKRGDKNTEKNRYKRGDTHNKKRK